MHHQLNRFIMVTLSVILVSVGLSSCFARWVEQKSNRIYNQQLSKSPFDVVIVPGYPFDGKAWDKIVKLRVGWAVYLYRTGMTKHIIFSGSAVYSPYVESRIMKYYAVALGVPDSVIYTEEAAEHSTENVFLSYHMAQQLGYKRIALASDPWQTEWMRNFFEKHDLKFEALPAIIEKVDSMHLGQPSINPEPARVDSFISITERESFRQRFRGTRGKNIDWQNGTVR